MARPEWDLAIICERLGIKPINLYDLLKGRDGECLRDIGEVERRFGMEYWPSVLAAVEATGAVSEIVDPNIPPEKRCWRVSDSDLDSLVRSVSLIFDVLPDAKKRFGSDNTFRIAATIPEKLKELKIFFSEFESTSLGLRRLISEATEELIILVPFMDEEGFSEIFPSLARALGRGVSVTFLTREIGEGGRNMRILSSLIDEAKKVKGNLLKLCEAVLTNNFPISHAKVFSRDKGAEVYIGSANLTAASMERTIEIGVFLKGSEAYPVGGFLTLVQELSFQRWP